MKKKYEAVYVNPNFCDGFWDNEKTKYLEHGEIKDLLYQNLENNEIEEILNRNELNNIKEIEKSNMSNLKLALSGMGLVAIGMFGIVWYIVKLISCIMIATLISSKLGLGGHYWWFSSVIIFCILGRFVYLFKENSSNTYSDLVEKYNDKVKE